MKQQRWVCSDCGREWCEPGFASLDPKSAGRGKAFERPWTPDLGCIAPDCTSMNISRVEFEGWLDSNTPADVYARAFVPPPAEPSVQQAPLPLVLLAPPEALEQDWIGLAEGRYR